MYSDQPVMPSSVVTFRKELTRQPASQCRSSILTIFTEFSSREKHPSPHPNPLRPQGRRGSLGSADVPSPPFRGEREGPIAQRWEGEVGNLFIHGSRCRRAPVRDRRGTEPGSRSSGSDRALS